MSWREFSYWQAYLKIEPPEEGDNKRMASLLAQITNMSGRVLPDHQSVKPEDFFGGSAKQDEQQSMEEQIAFMKSMGKSDGH